MKKLTVFFFLLLVARLLVAQPIWYVRPTSVYQPADYIVGVGEGASYEEAIKAATISLEQQLSILIKPSDNLEDTDPSQETTPYFAAYIYENSHKITNQLIKKLEVRQRLQVGNVFYALVALQKHNVLATIKRDINNLWAKVQKEKETAEQYKTDLHYISALGVYAKAQQTLYELCMNKLFHDNLATEPYAVDEALSETYIENQVKELISNIYFEVISGNQQTTQRGTLLPQPIIFYACAKKNGKNITLGKLPVSICYGDGTLIENGVTKPDGTYQIYAIGIPQADNRGKISIQIDHITFPGFFNRTFKNKTVSANYQTTETSSLLVSLTVVGTDGKQIVGAQSHIANLLYSQNIRESDRAPVYVRGTTDIVNKKMLNQAWDIRNEVKVTIDLEFGIMLTNEVLGVIHCIGEGISERSEQEAINLAFINTNINQQELNNMVVKATNAIANFNEATSTEYLSRGKKLYIEGHFTEALDSLMKVNIGEENIHEAVTLINIIKAYIRK